MALAQRISHERLRRGWSRSDLARRAGIDPSYVTRIEQARFRAPSVEKVRAISDALGLDLTRLTDPPPPENPDEDALLRRLIEKKLGSKANAELVQATLDRIRGRPPADQQTVIRMLGVLIESLPDAPDA